MEPTTAAEAALEEIRAALAGVVALLEEKGLAREWSRFGFIAAGVQERGAPAEEMLRALADTFAHATSHRDGLADFYISDDDWGVDREATDRLEELVERIAAALRPWGPQAG